MDYKKHIITARDRLTGAKSLKAWRLLLGVVIALLLAQTSASLTWKVVGLISGPDEDVSIGSGRSDKPQLLPLISAVAKIVAPTDELALFGKAGKVEISSLPLELDAQVAPKTSLALILKGIIMAEPRSRALAIIVEKGKKIGDELYGIGDKLPGNAVISDIFADRVILRRGGVLETLMLQSKERASLAKSVGGKQLNKQNIVNLGDGVHWKIDSSYLNKQLGDIASLAKEVGVEVYKENNVQKGYRLVSARGSKLLRDMGLQPGDILHEVNGVQLKTIHDGLSVYQGMRSAQKIQVVIGRNGRRETRIYEINSGG